MIDTDLKPGEKVYFISYNPHRNLPGDDFNADNYETLSASLLSMSDAEAFLESTQSGRFSLPAHEVFKTEQEAHCYRYWKTYENLKTYVATALRKDDLPREPVRPNFEAAFTCNPMRITERNLAFGGQGNVWGRDVNVQKIILLLVVTVEDLKMLAAILELIPFVNDYAKKLIGKFMVVELNSLFALLNGSKGVKGVKGLKDFNSDYAKTGFRQLIEKIRELETKYEYKSLRDKMAAHKDASLDVDQYREQWNNITKENLTEYCNLLIEHIGRSVAKYYPREARLYFPLSKSKFHDVIAVANSNESYKPFDCFKM